jgi:hypothetical protein
MRGRGAVSLLFIVLSLPPPVAARNFSSSLPLKVYDYYPNEAPENSLGEIEINAK